MNAPGPEGISSTKNSPGRKHLGDPSYAAAAKRLQDTFAREDGAERAADELEALAAR